MLAQNYKTAEELGLSEAGLQGLIKVLGLLERKELKWAIPYNKDNTHDGFNMCISMAKGKCSTVGCIVGWARAVTGQENLFDYCCSGTKRDEFENLIMPQGYAIIHNQEIMDVPHAAHALRTYLTTGHAEWPTKEA